MTFSLVLVYIAWAVTVFDLHYFLGNVVAPPLGRLAVVVYVPLLAMMAIRAPMTLGSSKPWVWYAPFLLLLLPGVVTFPTVANTGLARTVMQYLLIYYVLALATVVYVRTARQAIPIIAMMCLQFVWWAIQGRANGRIMWHPWLANFDSFGTLMVMGVAISYWFAVAARSKWLKRLLYVVAAYSVMGVVVSFARGAFLSLGLVAVWIWIRSPRKMLTAAGGVLAIAIVAVTSALLFPDGSFWSEIGSAFEQGSDEGTGGVRIDLWTAAFQVFKEHPIFGVGGGNVGAFAARLLGDRELEAFPNPGVLYGMNLHSTPMQILSEFGVVGAAGFLWIIVDFQIKNRALRKPEACERWSARSGGAFDLWALALGLEAANIGLLLNGLVYSSFLTPWYYTVWATNRMLWAVVGPDAKSETSSRRRRRSRHREAATPPPTDAEPSEAVAPLSLREREVPIRNSPP